MWFRCDLGQQHASQPPVCDLHHRVLFRSLTQSCTLLFPIWMCACVFVCVRVFFKLKHGCYLWRSQTSVSISNVESGDTGLKAEPVRRRGGHSGWGGGAEGPHEKTSPNLRHFRRRERSITWMTAETEGESLSDLADFRLGFQSHPAVTQKQKIQPQPTLSLHSPLCFETCQKKLNLNLLIASWQWAGD